MFEIRFGSLIAKIVRFGKGCISAEQGDTCKNGVVLSWVLFDPTSTSIRCLLRLLLSLCLQVILVNLIIMFLQMKNDAEQASSHASNHRKVAMGTFRNEYYTIFMWGIVGVWNADMRNTVNQNYKTNRTLQIG